MNKVTGLIVLLSCIALFAQQRFYDKPMNLESRATQIDLQNIHETQIESIIIDEMGKLIKIKVIENKEFDHEALEEEMYLWRIRTKYWGSQEAMEYLFSVTTQVI